MGQRSVVVVVVVCLCVLGGGLQDLLVRIVML